MLQKTLLNIEGLGRQLDPDLDLWKTAQPFLEKWMSQQLGWRGFVAAMKQEAPNWSRTLPRIPRLIHQALDPAHRGNSNALAEVAAATRQLRRWVALAVGLSATLLGLELVRWLR
jgi:ubiquinone biosynthesis protein